jgi:NADPH:quinone reductase-like Zn-dependent oxidoreductase
MQSPSSNRPANYSDDKTARSLWYSAPGRAEIRDEPLRDPGASEVSVRALYSAISRGTERLVFAGRVPPSEYERMRAPFMCGRFPFPVKYGYAIVGRVEQGPAELEGRLVFALHPHESRFTLPAEAVVPVPENVPPARAVLAANMETALNAMWDAAPGPADRIAVIGAGVIGALVAWLCGRLPGARVTLVDIEPSRAELARTLEVGFSAPEDAPENCDLVVHASATAAGLATALRLAGEEATVLEMSWYGSEEVSVPLGGTFHSRRLQLISSQVGKVAPSHRARWTHARRLAAALDLLAEPALDALIAPAVTFDELPARLPDILAPESGMLCQLVEYPAAG